MQDSIYVKGKACPDRFKKIMFDGLKKSMNKGNKELKEKEKDKMFSLPRNRSGFKDEKTTYERLALLSYESIY